MNFDINDPMWTAYAFGELDAQVRAAVEVELRDNPAARQFVAELQQTGELLKSALAKEPVARLTAEQRATLVAAVNDQPSAVGSHSVAIPPMQTKLRNRRRWVAVLGAVAASGLIAALLLPAMQSAREAGSRIAKKKTTTTHADSDKSAVNILSDDGEAHSIQTHESARTSTLNSTVLAGEHVGQIDSYGQTAGNRGFSAATGYGSTAAVDSAPGRQFEAGSFSANLPTPGVASAGGVPSSTSSLAGDQRMPSVSYTVPKPVYETKSEDSSTPRGNSLATEGRVNREAGGLIGTPQIEFLEGLNQIVVRGHPRDVERTVEIIREIEAQSVPAPTAGNLRAIPIKEAEVAKLLAELREIQGRNQAAANEPNTGEAYDLPPENTFEPVATNPLSTFSIDVDTASYANIRRFLTQNNHLPPPAAVRIEEMLNYFRYDYSQPEGDVPFSVKTEVATCPWNTDHRLVRVGLKGKEIAREKRPVSNLVFLLDVSGSMQDTNKLPLVREVMKLFVRELSENDRVAIVVYAGASGMVLDSTTGDQKNAIIGAIDQLQAGGSTNGAGGIQMAYDVAMQHFVKGGTNRVILATDGDFNVGITDRGDLVRLIEEKAKSGVFLTTLGFGMGNLKDATLEQLANKGNGNYAYIDTMTEGRKVLVEEMAGTLVTIAKDVKVQIEFNPAEVASYRLIGYENRRLAAEDFNDDKKDAGEIGAGHTVTALYELVPAKATAARGESSGQVAAQPGVDPLRYQKPAAAKVDLTDAANTGELFTLKLRYKQPEGDTSKLIEHPVKDSGKAYRDASGDFKFAASVAAFGMTLRRSQHRGTITLDGIKELAMEGRSFDPSGYRSEFVTLIEKAQALGAK